MKRKLRDILPLFMQTNFLKSSAAIKPIYPTIEQREQYGYVFCVGIVNLFLKYSTQNDMRTHVFDLLQIAIHYSVSLQLFVRNCLYLGLEVIAVLYTNGQMNVELALELLFVVETYNIGSVCTSCREKITNCFQRRNTRMLQSSINSHTKYVEMLHELGFFYFICWITSPATL